MSRPMLLLSMFLAALSLGACTSSDEDAGDVAKKAAAPKAALVSPKTTDDKEIRNVISWILSR